MTTQADLSQPWFVIMIHFSPFMLSSGIDFVESRKLTALKVLLWVSWSTILPVIRFVKLFECAPLAFSLLSLKRLWFLSRTETAIPNPKFEVYIIYMHRESREEHRESRGKHRESRREHRESRREHRGSTKEVLWGSAESAVGGSLNYDTRL